MSAGANDLDSEQMRDSARRVLADKLDRRTAWGERETPAGRSLRDEMTALGWHLSTAPEELGGFGQSFSALAPIYEELGRALAPTSLSHTMAAVDVLVGDDGEAARELLRRIIAGEVSVAIAFFGPGQTGSHDFGLVEAPHLATHALLLPACGGGAAGIVDLGGDGAEIQLVETWDRGRSFGDLRLSGAKRVPLAIDGASATRIARAHLDLAMAWDSIGAAEKALGEAVDYMGTRHQFGRPIGSFQALKHRAADLKVGVEIAKALARRATDRYAQRGDNWSEFAGQARILAIDAFRAVAEDCVQFHGGIGFTWEHDCHLFLKRALMNEVLGETLDAVRDRIAQDVFKRAIAKE